jgi:hypothetical protein
LLYEQRDPATAEVAFRQGVALRLDMHEQSVRRKIAAGEIPALQLGGPGCALRVLEDELSSWLEEHRNGEAA